MNHEELVSLIKGQKIQQILVANMFPDGDSCGGDILIEEIILENGTRILFEGSPRTEIKNGGGALKECSMDADGVASLVIGYADKYNDLDQIAELIKLDYEWIGDLVGAIKAGDLDVALNNRGYKLAVGRPRLLVVKDE